VVWIFPVNGVRDVVVLRGSSRSSRVARMRG